ncbi:hypothetical protein [Glutamicibacter ardleyensis]|uniref:Uncharacterized protein n=1 Tax=Glutamicibacter ardleyensis TaxID=225894 RepID=A0ABQ2DXH0_9MICC|nr:hypothetical protein [Glutamicibacter ardleyensis]GGJ72855.1 hypothetical protein GCM10007173_34840 [Glutamicibacter ardleyensis]
MTNPDFTGKTTPTPTPTTPTTEKRIPMRNYTINASTGEGTLPGYNYNLPRILRNISRALNKHNLDAPQVLLNGLIATVTDAKKRASELGAENHGQHLDNAAQAVINGEDPEEHLMRYVAWGQTYHALPQRIEELSRSNFIQAVNDNADNITRQIGDKLFFPALAELSKLIQAHPGKQWNIDIAVNAEDYQHAETIKKHAYIAETLHAACELRGMLYNEETFTDSAAYMTLPGFVGTIRTDSLQWWATVLGQGHSLWFPTATDWHKATHGQEYTEHREAEAKALAELNSEAEAEKPEPYQPDRAVSRSAY